MSFRGIDIRESGTGLLFRALLQDSSGALVPSGTTQLRLYEYQSDGRLYQYSFNADTPWIFTSGLLTNPSGVMQQRKTQSAQDLTDGKDTGIYTYLLPHVSGFIPGNLYLARTTCSSASPVDQYREFQFGDGVFANIQSVQDKPPLIVFPSSVWTAQFGDYNVNETFGSGLNRLHLRELYHDKIWIDTASGILGNTLGVNGLQHRPCKDIVDAQLLAEKLGTRQLHVMNGCSITLSGTMEHFCFGGFEPYEVVLNSKDISGTHFRNAHITGSGTAATYQPIFDYCKFHTCIVPAFIGHNCHINGQITLGSDVIGDDSFAFIGINFVGETGATIDMNNNGAKSMQLLGFGGKLTIQNMNSVSDTLRIEGGANLTIQSSCTAGDLDLHGNFDITDNSAGVTITKTAVYNLTQVASGVWGAPTSLYNVDGVFGGQLQPIYYADIKYYNDSANTDSEYSVCWFKNNTAVPSGNLTNPALSVYNTVDGTAVFQNQTMDFVSVNLGVTRHNSNLILSSGEPYLAIASGTIDGSNVSWKKIIGTHVF